MKIITSLKLPVYGMNCANCAVALQNALNQIQGIDAQVNFTLESALINFYDTVDHSNTLSNILIVLEKKGYQTDTETILMSVTGWHCMSCANKTTNILNKQPLVIEAQSNLATEVIQIRTIQGALTLQHITELSQLTPYELTIKSKTNLETQNIQKLKQQQQKNQRELLTIVIAMLLSLPFLISMINMAINHGEQFISPWLEFLLATPVQFIIGWRFYKGAWFSLKTYSTNMDVLVVLGSSAAYFYSLVLLVNGSDHPLYFESSTLVISLVTLGKYLEHRAKQSTSAAINALMSLRPNKARVKKGKKFIEVDIQDIQIDDLVEISIGESVAVDGTVIQGESYIDESLLTGESDPIFKQRTSTVIAGSINGDGVLLIKTTAVGEDTTLNKIISLVENAQMSKAPVMQLVDKISAIFVPIVLVIATITFLSWILITGDFQQALISTVSVLVIACPCALGLATPTAVVVGTGVAAQHGILIKDIKTLQQAHRLQTVIFDKTGTLTKGNGQITDIVNLFGDNNMFFSKLNALQAGSKHPIANAIKSYSLKHNISISHAEQVQSINGEGVHGQINGFTVIAGNQSMMERFGVDIPDTYRHKAIQQQGSLVYIAENGRFYGYITIVDQIRPESAPAIQALQKRHINTVILSGDKHSNVEEISNKLHINRFFSELKPQEKLVHLQALQQQELVAMVGDGVNDAPALAAADVSIAMGSGSDVAKQSASITLMRSDPRLVATAIDISKATWRKIQQNLFWAFIFNSIAIPAAALGYLNPAIAGAAMASSSITVLTNSLLLKRFKQ
jgi:Cu+-exporting ATPase